MKHDVIIRARGVVKHFPAKHFFMLPSLQGSD